jgi:hypothetical protein
MILLLEFTAAADACQIRVVDSDPCIVYNQCSVVNVM